MNTPGNSPRDRADGTRLVLIDENGEILEEVIEDEPDRIDLASFFKTYLRSWKLLVLAMVVCGALMGYLRPGTTSTVEGATVTLYIPPYVYKEIDGRDVRISNNTTQISNALGLIQSKVYRDLVAEQLGADSLSGYGSYSVTRQKDTEIITIRTVGSDREKAMALCTAVKEVLTNRVGTEVSINEMLEVDPVTPYTNVTVTSTIRSVVNGALMGAALYTVYAAVVYFKDRTLATREEAEQYLGLPVMAVFPIIEDHQESPSSGRRSRRSVKSLHSLSQFRQEKDRNGFMNGSGKGTDHEE